MKYQSNASRVIFVVFLYLSFVFNLQAEQVWNVSDSLHMGCGGEYTQENFVATNLNLLNSAIEIDDTSFYRTTFDCFMSSKYGDKDNPRLYFYNAIRFRYVWGSTTDASLAKKQINLVDTTITAPATGVNKHLLWMRESWIKIALGSKLGENQSFVQIGLIPYQVGRGISLGAAYDATGFLGFISDYTIEQYAPAVLLNMNIAKNCDTDCYLAITESHQNSIAENIESVRTGDLDGCLIRGIGRQTYVLAVHNKTCFRGDNNQKWTVEPYIVHQQGPDKPFEFNNDVDSSLSTIGFAVETEYNKLNWGFEGGCNLGDFYIKPWDRNTINVIKDDNGFFVEQYTKIYNKSPAFVDAKLVDVTSINEKYVDGSANDVSANGKQIGPNLFNAFDRFRPAQNINLSGYFFVADVTYDYIPKVLQWSFGVAYFSGGIHQQQDMNRVKPDDCMNQNFTGFIPLQSIYAGTRVKSFVMLNQGLPMFAVRNPHEHFAKQNINPAMMLDTLNTTTNIAFVGGSFSWSPQYFKSNELKLSPNVLSYWAPETPHAPPVHVKDPEYALKPVDNFLGTELNLEISAKIINDFKLLAYFGVLFPGSYYKEMKGTLVKSFSLPIGNDLVYIGNIAFVYSF